MTPKTSLRKRDSTFDVEQVRRVSGHLQNYMRTRRIESLTADEAAQILAVDNILPNDVGPKPGFNFRQMLRDGRGGLIPMVAGAEQKRPNTRWSINRVK